MRKTKSLYNNPKYQGKHVLISEKGVYAVKTAKQASVLFDKLVRDTGMIPTVTFVPKAQSLILICR